MPVHRAPVIRTTSSAAAGRGLSEATTCGGTRTACPCDGWSHEARVLR